MAAASAVKLPFNRKHDEIAAASCRARLVKIGARCFSPQFDVGPLVPEPAISQLGQLLKARRRQKRLSLRDLADQIGVSSNTLSRVERGHVPDLRNLRLIADWLEVPVEVFIDSDSPSTPEVIARHLASDKQLGPAAAARIASLVEDMYRSLISEQPRIEVHLRSARTFTPAAGAALADILADMQAALSDSAER